MAKNLMATGHSNSRQMYYVCCMLTTEKGPGETFGQKRKENTSHAHICSPQHVAVIGIMGKIKKRLAVPMSIICGRTCGERTKKHTVPPSNTAQSRPTNKAPVVVLELLGPR